MTEADSLVIKATVVLDKPSDWTKWLFLRKDSAERNQLWPYIDPSLSDNQVKKIESERPREKEPQEFCSQQLAQESDEEFTILDLTDKEVARYELWLKVFTRQEAVWLKKERALRDFSYEISRTIASRHIHLITDCPSAYDRLKTLKKHLCPSTSERNYQLRAHYQSLQSQPKKGSLDSWFEDWLETTRQMKEAALPEVAANRAQEDFIRAVRQLDKSWATHQLTELVRKDQAEASFTAIADLVAEYRSYCRRIRPTASSPGTFATLGVALQEKGDTKEKASRGPTCLCGEKHRFIACPYINTTLRGASWKPDQQVVQKFDKLRTSQGYLAQVLERAEKNLRKTSESGRGGESTICNDDRPPLGTAQPYAVLQTAAAVSLMGEKDVQPPLINRWVLDPGSNAHVTNSKAFGWTTTAQARPGQCVYADGQLIQIEEWGEMQLQVNTPSGPRTFKLTYVAYIPGLFASVVGLLRCRSLGIHFDSGRNCLYQHSPSQVICHLEYKDGRWLVDTDEAARPSPEALLVYAAKYQPKPSREERRPLRVSSMEAHRTFGHVNQEAISHLAQNVDRLRII